MSGPKMWITAPVVITVLAIGWAAMSDDAPTTPPVDAGTQTIAPARPTATSVVPPPAEPETTDASAVPTEPQRQRRSEAGARAAAVAYLEMTEDAVALAPAEAAAVQRSIATAAFAEEFGADTEQRMIELSASVPGGIVLRVAPIGVRSVADGDDWLVSVWYVQTITIIGEAVVDDWRTADYRLAWEGDAWKIASFASVRGPMPGRGTQPGSAAPTDFEAGLAGFTDRGLG